MVGDMGGITLDAFNHLVHRIYQAGLDPKEWPVFVEDFAELLGGSIICLQAHDRLASSSLGFISSKADPEFLGSYSRYYSTKNVWAEGMANSPIGRVVQSEEICPRDALLKTEFYNDYLRTQDLITASGVILHRSSDNFLFISGNIRDQVEDQFRSPMQRMFKLLGPHISRSMGLTRSIPSLLEGEDIRHTTEKSADAIFLINSSGRLVHANRVGDELRRQALVLRVDRSARIHFLDQLADEALQRGLRDILKRDFIQTQGNFTVRRTSGLPLNASITPLQRHSSAIIFDQVFENRPVAMLVIQKPPVRQELADAFTGYGLTPAERALALAIAQGQSPRDFADERGLSIHTVRTQLKSVYAKTGTNRQSQLAGLPVLGTAAPK